MQIIFFFRYFYQSLDSVQISVFQRWMITRVCIMVAVMGVREGGEFVNMWGSQYGHSEFTFTLYGRHNCMAAILKIQNGRHGGLSVNVNIDFRILHVITFPKMYRLSNLPRL